MSRIGKIARLPRAVREELNWRLLDGEQQSRLVEWLNGREEVQAMLRAEFSGQPINEPNLTAWVQGGFEDWRRQQEATEAAGRLAEESRALAAISGDQCLVDRVSMMAALALGEQLMAVRPRAGAAAEIGSRARTRAARSGGGRANGGGT
jgi:hypothetical protein